jgi:hypothetical protein
MIYSFPLFLTSNNVCEHYIFSNVLLSINGVDGIHVHLTSGVQFRSHHRHAKNIINMINLATMEVPSYISFSMCVDFNGFQIL